MGLGAGEVFTTRNIANLVNNTDLSVMSVINYAVCVASIPQAFPEEFLLTF